MTESSDRELSVVPPRPWSIRNASPGQPEWWFNLATVWPPDDMWDVEAQFLEQMVRQVQGDLALEPGADTLESGVMTALAQRAVNRVLSYLVAPDSYAFGHTWYHLLARWDAATAEPDTGPMDRAELTSRAFDEHYDHATKAHRRGMPDTTQASGVERADGQWFVNLCDDGLHTQALYRIDHDGTQHTLTWVPEDEWPERFQEVE